MTDQQQESPKIVITVNGKTTIIDYAALNGRQRRDFREATGVSTIKAFSDMDLDYAAALLWVVRKQGNSKLTLDELLDEMTFENTTFDAGDGGGDEEDPDHPEA